MLEQLRQTMRKMERPAGLEDAGALPFGIPEIDGLLGGGLPRGALHEIAAASEAHVAAATGFALGLSFGLSRARTAMLGAVWIAHGMAFAENGWPHIFEGFPLAPKRLLIAHVTKTRDMLWAMEEALHCRAVNAVIGELRNESIDTVALRRLSLAAADRNVPALLLRASPPHIASTAATRWVVSAAPSQHRFGPGQPRWRTQLTRNRRGPGGDWILEWSTDERFILAPTHPQPVARPAADRPPLTAVA